MTATQVAQLDVQRILNARLDLAAYLTKAPPNMDLAPLLCALKNLDVALDNAGVPR